MNRLAQSLATLAAGILFGFGLSYATMIQPQVVLAFLRWHDAGLLLVMGGAVTVVLLTFQLAPRLLRKPLLSDSFQKQTGNWNRKTATGAALFGIGWGLCGVCPGPAIAALGTGHWDIGWSVAGIAIGALLQGWFSAPPVQE